VGPIEQPLKVVLSHSKGLVFFSCKFLWFGRFVGYLALTFLVRDSA